LSVVNADDWGLLIAFGHRQKLLGFGQSERSDALSALDTRYVPLSLIIEVEEDNVVASWVNHLVLVQVKNVVLDLSLETCYKLRH